MWAQLMEASSLALPPNQLVWSRKQSQPRELYCSWEQNKSLSLQVLRMLVRCIEQQGAVSLCSTWLRLSLWRRTVIVLIILRRVIFFCSMWVSLTYGPAAPLVTGVYGGRTTSICLHPPAIDFTELPRREETKIKITSVSKMQRNG